MGMTMGNVYGILGAALAVALACIGSAIGVSRAGQASAGLLSKDTSKFGNVLVLQLLPASQGLYGFVVAFLAVFVKINVMGGENMNMLTTGEGLALMCICVPIGIVGLFSAIMQGNVAVAGINLIGKQDKQLSKAIIMTAMVEIFALFAFIVSILGVLGLSVTTAEQAKAALEAAAAALAA